MKPLKLYMKIGIFISILLLVTVSILGYSFMRMMSTTFESQTGERALHVATTLANMPSIRAAFTEENPSALLQPIAEEVRKTTGAEFVVIGNREGIRYAHPIEDRIGKKMVGGDNDRALLHGESYISKAVGSLGPSLRGKAPIKNEEGDIIGIVSVGFLLEDIDAIVHQYRVKIIFLVVTVLMIGGIGSIYIAKGVKRAIFGLEPHEIARLFVEKNGILQSVREGILAIDEKGAITMVNQQAYDLLPLDPSVDYVGKSIREVLPQSRMIDVLDSKESQFDEQVSYEGHELIVNRVPIFEEGEMMGVVSSFRRKNEIDLLTKQLSHVHRYAEALRAQTHEFANKLNTISGLIQLGSYTEAIEYIHKETDGAQTIVKRVMKAIPDPIIAAIVIGKFNRAQELKIDFHIDKESQLQDSLDEMDREKLVTILGNLLDNAFEAVLASGNANKKVKLFMTDLGHDFIFEIEDNGRGISEEEFPRLFERGFSTKQGEDRGVGLYLVQEAVTHLGGVITVGNGKFGGAIFTVIIPKRGRDE
ncbi:ATP-binding protein [Bacillus kexueae]|uniref:ATP-binding protein n=1 Tax=Aeribacillus kexueae TaxID=2078952 RepID=UPI001FAEDB3B|nr:sensor histidine kinase [Bacillus kexueae]